MSRTKDVPQKRYSLQRLARIALAAVVTFCVCLAFLVFANRDNPSNTPTLAVEGLATAATSLAPSATAHGTLSVNLTLSLGLQGSVLNIQGRTDLPDRAILLYRVSHVAPDSRSTDGTLAVLNGEYSTQVDLSGWPSGTVEVWVGFQPVFGNSEQQPQEVIELYGPRGEYLHGENVIDDGGFKRVEARQTIEIFP